jgi:hypothetical protein
MLRSNNNQLELLDLLSIASFCIGLMNLDENITQGDMQDLEQQFNTQTKKVLDEIHNHLKSQDLKIDEILNKLKELEQ